MGKRTVTLYPPGGGEPVEALDHQAPAMEARGWTRAPDDEQAGTRRARLEAAMRAIRDEVRSGAITGPRLTADGRPRVEEIEARAGIADVSAAERDAIWASLSEDE